MASNESGLSNTKEDGVAVGEQRELVETHVNKILEGIPEDLGSVVLKATVNRHSRTTKCHLLGLPAEIRNRIFRYVLVEDDLIAISTTSPPPPGLLTACKDIREQTIQLYNSENSFRIFVDNFNARPIIPRYRWHRRYHVPKPGVEMFHSVKVINIAGRKDWTNLVDWCEAVHAKKIIGFQSKAVGVIEQRTISSMFEITAAMRARPCTELEEVLNAFRDILVAADPTWAT